MKNKNKPLCINEKKACIIGIIMSLVFSFVISLVSSSIMINFGFLDGKVSIMTLTNIIFPILFIILGIFVLCFIIICSFENKK